MSISQTLLRLKMALRQFEAKRDQGIFSYEDLEDIAKITEELISQLDPAEREAQIISFTDPPIVIDVSSLPERVRKGDTVALKALEDLVEVMA